MQSIVIPPFQLRHKEQSSSSDSLTISIFTKSSSNSRNVSTSTVRSLPEIAKSIKFLKASKTSNFPVIFVLEILIPFNFLQFLSSSIFPSTPVVDFYTHLKYLNLLDYIQMIHSLTISLSLYSQSTFSKIIGHIAFILSASSSSQSNSKSGKLCIVK